MYYPFQGWRQRLRDRPDREHEITINRLVISLGIFVYVWFLMPGRPEQTAEARIIALTYFTSALVLFVHLLARPGISASRRLVAIGVDLILLSCGLYAGGEYVTILYPFYYWIIFGNGFRYGVKYLYIATALGACGFLAVTQTSEYWLNNRPLGVGLLAGVIILPIYASTLIRSLSLAREQAEQASHAKSQFLASVSHELRTPLNAVVGMSDLIGDTALHPDQREMVETIKTSSKALLALIDDLLDFAQIEAGTYRLNSVEFDLAKVLTEVREIGVVQAAAKGLYFHLHVAPHTPSLLIGDERRLREVLLNLVGNAVKFTEQGGIIISADGTTNAGATKLRIEVSDTGIGIASSAREKIFERFTQADETILNRFGGTGLGLAISQKLVQLMGGAISVESILGRGSTFSLVLPFESEGAPSMVLESLAAVEVLLLGGTVTELESAERQLRPVCGSVRLVDNVLEAVRLVRAPSSTLIRQRIVLLIGEKGRALVSGEGPLKLAELEAARPAGIFLVSDLLESPPDKITQRLVSAVLNAERLTEDLQMILRFARGGRAAVPAHEPLIKRRSRSLKILVADDNHVNQKVIRLILEAGGHQVVLADDGEQALDKLDAQLFDLVVMDLNMPVMDGIEATKLYRMETIGGQRVPIIGLTADATPAAADRAREAGMDACLTKPLNGPLLLDRIDELTAEQMQVGSETRASPSRMAPTSEQSLIDAEMLENLKTLGGVAFLKDVISTFLVDGASILADMQDAVAQGDVTRFNEKAHALQSGAGNIGVQGLAERCRLWRPKSADDLRTNGPAVFDGIRSDFEAARTHFLRNYVSGPVLIFDPQQSDIH